MIQAVKPKVIDEVRLSSKLVIVNFVEQVEDEHHPETINKLSIIIKQERSRPIMDELKVKRFLTTVKSDSILGLCNLAQAWLGLSGCLEEASLAGKS